jgi:hypothetical protein
MTAGFFVVFVIARSASDEANPDYFRGKILDCFASGYAQKRFAGLLPGVARAASVDGSLAMTMWRG